MLSEYIDARALSERGDRKGLLLVDFTGPMRPESRKELRSEIFALHDLREPCENGQARFIACYDRAASVFISAFKNAHPRTICGNTMVVP